MTVCNLSASLDEVMVDLEADKIVPRIWDHDYTVWKSEPAEISNRLGWLHIARVMEQTTCYMKAVTDAARDDGYTHVLLLGMGGSSLAPEVFRKTFGVEDGYLDLAVLDSTDPGAVLAHAKRLEMERTLFIVATKSGSTVETLSLFKFFYNRMVDAVGLERAGKHFIAITDPGSGLANLAKRYGFQWTFLNDSTIGGRYSALSYFGLVPAMLAGVDVAKLLDRATAMMCKCKESSNLNDNPGARLGAIMGALATDRRDKVTLIASPPISAFGAWVEQLIAESTGKEGTGILPVDGEKPGPPEVYGQDRFFVYLRLEGDETYDSAVQALRCKKQPVVQIDLQDPYDLGGEFFRWEFATAIAAHILDVNPFDQPNVEAAKILAGSMVSVYEKTHRLPTAIPRPDGNGLVVDVENTENDPRQVLNSFLAQAEAGDYVAFQAYVQPTCRTDRVLQQLRIQLRDRLKLATTVGYGPRFLHSTGQLHKGDAGKGFFIQFTADSQKDISIPYEAGSSASSITFGVFKSAQALGDRQALLDATPERKVISFHLGTDVVRGLERFLETTTRSK